MVLNETVIYKNSHLNPVNGIFFPNCNCNPCDSLLAPDRYRCKTILVCLEMQFGIKFGSH